ncbi:MAG: 4a-hydroxytetrahydrobiopterin dehydratase [Pseudomonadota bacterium]
MSDIIDLASRKCAPCEGGVAPLDRQQVDAMLGHLPDWSFQDGVITRTFKFKNHHDTMAFVNAVAWISHREDHHPDMKVGYNTCTIAYSTHAINGLSENDFICAAKVDRLLGH